MKVGILTIKTNSKNILSRMESDLLKEFEKDIREGNITLTLNHGYLEFLITKKEFLREFGRRIKALKNRMKMLSLRAMGVKIEWKIIQK
jgi:predicted glycosyl hydrolase (DUF1957 family)